jgi:hypothetical protein
MGGFINILVMYNKTVGKGVVRVPGWRIHGGVEDTKLSTNKQHSLSYTEFLHTDMKYRRAPFTVAHCIFIGEPTNPGPPLLPAETCPWSPNPTLLSTCLNDEKWILFVNEPYSTIFSLITNLESMFVNPKDPGMFTSNTPPPSFTQYPSPPRSLVRDG